MVRTLALVLAALFMACGDSSQYAEPIDDQVAAVTVEGWAAAGLPEPGDRCYVDRYRIEWALDAADFEDLCWVPPSKAFSCFLWRLEVHPAMGLFSRTYPAAMLRPGIEDPLIAPLGVHEFVHGLADCVLVRPLSDPYDAMHTDPLLWIGPGGEASAEGRARSALGMAMPPEMADPATWCAHSVQAARPPQ